MKQDYLFLFCLFFPVFISPMSKRDLSSCKFQEMSDLFKKKELDKDGIEITYWYRPKPEVKPHILEARNFFGNSDKKSFRRINYENKRRKMYFSLLPNISSLNKDQQLFINSYFYRHRLNNFFVTSYADFYKIFFNRLDDDLKVLMVEFFENETIRSQVNFILEAILSGKMNSNTRPKIIYNNKYYYIKLCNLNNTSFIYDDYVCEGSEYQILFNYFSSNGLNNDFIKFILEFCKFILAPDENKKLDEEVKWSNKGFVCFLYVEN